MIRRNRVYALAFLATLACVTLAAAADEKRSYRWSDFYGETAFNGFTFSPDGGALAYVARRPADSQMSNGLIIDRVRCDIWIQERPGQPARRLTDGASDSSGWFGPKWSPDGKWLAFFSTRGGNVTVWGWERETNKLRQLGREGADYDDAEIEWLDSRRLLYQAVPARQISTIGGEGGYFVGKGAERAMAAWAKAAKGEVTVSVVDSVKFALPQGRLFLIDVTSGAEKMVSESQVEPYRGRWISVGPRAAMFALPEPSDHGAWNRKQLGYPMPSVAIMRQDGTVLSLNKALPRNVLTTTIAWSPDGREVAFFANGDTPVSAQVLYRSAARDVVYPSGLSDESPARLWRVDLDRGYAEEIDTGDVDLGRGLVPPKFLWTGSGELIFYATRLSDRTKPRVETKPDWMVLARDGRTRPMTKDFKPLPSTLEPIESAAAFLALVDGELWRIDAGTGDRRNLTETFSPRVTQTHAMASGSPRSMWITVQVAKAGAAGNDSRQGTTPKPASDFLIDVRSGETIPVAAAANDEASILVVHPDSKGVVHLVDNGTGTFAWRSAVGAKVDLLLSGNTERAKVQLSEQRVIEYRSGSGQPLKARLHLPIGYQAGRRYPLIVDSDIGRSSQLSPSAYELSHPARRPLPSIETWTSMGFIHLYASVPTVTGMDEIGRGNLLLFTDGLLPAIDRAVELGLADPKRVFLHGLSSFGYGAFGIVTQTSRFAAAIADAGWTDLATGLLATDPVRRYSDNPFDMVIMGGVKLYTNSELPPWRDAEHYRRNSPLTYVDRVQTPLMIIHGEMDVYPLTDPEMFFSALVLQRKPAQIVRYWGEGHGEAGTPYNIYDKCRRMVAWFDQWGDISRDAAGNLIFEGDRVRSRKGAPPLKPEDYTGCGPLVPPARNPSTVRRAEQP